MKKVINEVVRRTCIGMKKGTHLKCQYTDRNGLACAVAEMLTPQAAVRLRDSSEHILRLIENKQVFRSDFLPEFQNLPLGLIAALQGLHDSAEGNRSYEGLAKADGALTRQGGFAVDLIHRGEYENAMYVCGQPKMAYAISKIREKADQYEHWVTPIVVSVREAHRSESQRVLD